MQAPIRTVTPAGEIDVRALQRNAVALGSLFALDAPDGLTFNQGANGTALVDQRNKRRLAIVQSGFGSGSGGTGSGIDRTGREVAADMLNAYNVKFAQWILENDTYVARELPAQPEVIAIEANSVQDVPDGAIIEVLPGFGQPDFYYFFWSGEIGSGSGGETFTVDCGDGSTQSFTLSYTGGQWVATAQ